MPMYEYKCESCSKQFELRQKFSDSPVKECPVCGGSVTKLISATSFALKGGGWHNENYTSSAKSEAPPTCPAASGGGCAGCPSAAA
jgi:putative FmdB family regulatory protein